MVAWVIFCYLVYIIEKTVRNIQPILRMSRKQPMSNRIVSKAYAAFLVQINARLETSVLQKNIPLMKLVNRLLTDFHGGATLTLWIQYQNIGVSILLSF